MGHNNSVNLDEAFSHASPAIQDAVLNFVQVLIQSENNE